MICVRVYVYIITFNPQKLKIIFYHFAYYKNDDHKFGL